MCKIFTVTGALSRAEIKNLLDLTADNFSHSQRDGFGFFATNKSGEIAVGKYLETFPGFNSGLPSFLLGEQNEIGALPSASNFLVMHGRQSTNMVCLENVHPFFQSNTYLVHNGVLDYIGAKENAPTASNSCDSEQFLNFLVSPKHHGNIDANNIKNSWAGYGAIFVYSSVTKNLSLIKCGSASLFCAARDGKGLVFATQKSDLTDICRRAKIKLRSSPVKVGQIIIDFLPNGDVKNHCEWKGFATRQWDKKSTQSLGNNIRVLTENGVQHLDKKGNLLTASEAKEQHRKNWENHNGKPTINDKDLSAYNAEKTKKIVARLLGK